jgi:predicted acetyltransferase
MRSLLHELHLRGTALSVLYPASRPLYRRVGYEMAGGRYEITLRPREIPLRERDLSIRAARPEDVPAIGRLFARSVARDYGPLDWGSAGWQRAMRTWRGPAYPRFVVAGEHGFEGYISYMAARKDHTLTVFDFFASTPRGARRLLTFLCDHRSQIEEAKWAGRLDEPLLLMLQEDSHRVNKAGAWMLRIVDVPAALAQRGYARSVRATLHLDIRDDVIAANRGRWTLEVAGGRGRVTRGGRGTIQVDVRGLAPLFSGHLAARDLVEWTPYLSTTPRQVAALEAVFPLASPWMAARF